MAPRKKNSKAADQSASCSAVTPLSAWTKKDLLNKLRSSPCSEPIPPKAGLDKLRQMVVDQGLHDAEMVDVKHFSVVKCALRKAMLRGRRDVFSRTFHGLFSDHAEQLVAGISMRLRLASVGLAAHVTELLNDGLHPPDLFQQKDTYWKNWLRFGAGGEADFPTASWPDDDVRLGLKVDKSDDSVAVKITVPSCTELYRPLVRVKLQTTADGAVALTIGLTDVNSQAKAIIHEMQPPVTLRLAVGTEEDGPIRAHIAAALPPVAAPQGDQVLNYAGRTLETVVCNNAWVPLWDRLQRLARTMLRPWKEEWRRSVDPSVRHAGSSDGVSAHKLIDAIRRPVARTLDFPEPARSWVEAVRDRLRRPEDDDRWLADDHGSNFTFGTIMSFNYWMQLCFREQGVRCMRLMPIIGVGRKHVRLDERTLSAVLGKVYKQTVDKLWPDAKSDKNGKVVHYGPNVSTSGLDSKAQEACEAAHRALAADDMMAFLPGAPRTKHSAGLVFKASLMTDGVSISLAYTKTTQRVKHYWQAPTSKATKKHLADGAGVADEDDEVSAKTYDKSLITTLALEDETVIVLGVDPGRVKIVSVAWLYDESTTIKWSLSGGQYHAESRLRSLTKEKEKRYRQLAPLFQSLAGEGSSTTTPWATEVKEYARRCAASWNEWWDVALRRRESRSALASYMGKARVMDGFYSRVLKDVSQAVAWMEEDSKPVRIEFAYGSAGPTMKATGRGELAVPTATAFKRCQAVAKAFTDSQEKRSIKQAATRRVHASVQLVDEFRTSAYCWETGQRNGKVYRIIDEMGNVSGVECLGPDSRPPSVPEAKRAGVKLWLERAAYRSNERRGGGGESLQKSVPEAADRRGGRERGNTYPEIRGLRFCTERRKFFGRDVSAAETIARLRVMELEGKPRPHVFSRP